MYDIAHITQLDHTPSTLSLSRSLYLALLIRLNHLGLSLTTSQVYSVCFLPPNNAAATCSSTLPIRE